MLHITNMPVFSKAYKACNACVMKKSTCILPPNKDCNKCVKLKPDNPKDTACNRCIEHRCKQCKDKNIEECHINSSKKRGPKKYGPKKYGTGKSKKYSESSLISAAELATFSVAKKSRLNEQLQPITRAEIAARIAANMDISIKSLINKSVQVIFDPLMDDGTVDKTKKPQIYDGIIKNLLFDNRILVVFNDGESIEIDATQIDYSNQNAELIHIA